MSKNFSEDAVKSIVGKKKKGLYFHLKQWSLRIISEILLIVLHLLLQDYFEFLK